MKKLIAYCLYGTDPLYLENMKVNEKLAQEMYQDWTVRIYTDLDYQPINPKTEVARCFPHQGTNLMFARFLAAADPEVERVIFRDADSWLSVREKAAVDEWISHGTDFHVMRDHPDHAVWPMLGGMWGVRGGVLKEMKEAIKSWPSHTIKLDDMRFLQQQIWPMATKSLTHHSSVVTNHEPSPMPFPEDRIAGNGHKPVFHVGQIMRAVPQRA